MSASERSAHEAVRPTASFNAAAPTPAEVRPSGHDQRDGLRADKIIDVQDEDAVQRDRPAEVHPRRDAGSRGMSKSEIRKNPASEDDGFGMRARSSTRCPAWLNPTVHWAAPRSRTRGRSLRDNPGRAHARGPRAAPRGGDSPYRSMCQTVARHGPNRPSKHSTRRVQHARRRECTNFQTRLC